MKIIRINYNIHTNDMKTNRKPNKKDMLLNKHNTMNAKYTTIINMTL